MISSHCWNERTSLNTSRRNAAETIWRFFLTHSCHADFVCKAALFNITCFSAAGVSIRSRHVTLESFWKKTGDKIAQAMQIKKSKPTLYKHKRSLIRGVEEQSYSWFSTLSQEPWKAGNAYSFTTVQTACIHFSRDVNCVERSVQEETGRTGQCL